MNNMKPTGRPLLALLVLSSCCLVQVHARAQRNAVSTERVSPSTAGQLAPSELERAAEAIDAALVAPCCFMQQVSVHPSRAAEEVRLDVRARLAAGQSRQQILDAYVARYGRRILAEPSPSGFGVMLYGGSIVLLLTSVVTVTLCLRRAVRPAARPLVTTTDVDAGTAARIDDELARLE